MTDLQAIAARRSRRSYTGPLPERDADALQAMAQHLAGGGLRIKLHRDDDAFGGFARSYGMFRGVRSFFEMIAQPQQDHTAERAGYAGQRLVLEATKRGMGSCWVGSTFDKGGISSALEEGEQLLCVIVMGTVAEGPTVRERLVRTTSHLKRKTDKQLYTAAETPPAWFLSGVRAALRAPSGLNAQPVHFSYQNGVASAAVPDVHITQRIDLGIAKLHFEIGAGGRFELGNGGEFHPAAR